MGKWLAATCKGLSVAAGPLGAIGEFALKLYDDERSEKRDAELREMIVGGKDISQETLERVFELKNDLSGVREQLINGIIAIRELLKVGQLSVSAPEELEVILTKSLIEENEDVLKRRNFITERELRDELNRLYGYGTSFERFLMLVEEGGFSTSSLPSRGSNDVIIFQFLRELEHRTMADRAKIFGQLANDSPSSTVLEAMRLLIEEQIQILSREEKRGGNEDYGEVKAVEIEIKPIAPNRAYKEKIALAKSIISNLNRRGKSTKTESAKLISELAHWEGVAEETLEIVSLLGDIEKAVCDIKVGSKGEMSAEEKVKIQALVILVNRFLLKAGVKARAPEDWKTEVESMSRGLLERAEVTGSNETLETILVSFSYLKELVRSDTFKQGNYHEQFEYHITKLEAYVPVFKMSMLKYVRTVLGEEHQGLAKVLDDFPAIKSLSKKPPTVASQGEPSKRQYRVKELPPKVKPSAEGSVEQVDK